MLKYGVLITIILIIIFYLIKAYYYYVLNNFFRNNNNEITYDYFIKYIHFVNKNNYFMNYGLWDNNKYNNMKKANINLCNFIFKNANLNYTDTFYILDIGCGYGKQDFILHKKLSQSSAIIAVDLSQTQIDFANKYRRSKHINKKQLHFIQGDAHCLMNYFNTKFNRILSIESAFHYKNRQLFFNNVSSLLTNDGLFVISDILLKDEYKSSIINKQFLTFASDLLCIPKKNHIKLTEWKQLLTNSNLQIVKMYDITDNTFIPYYKYFFKKYIQNKNLPAFIADILFYTLSSLQIFSYIVAVCNKPDDNSASKSTEIQI